jgi:hypothetical protein
MQMHVDNNNHKIDMSLSFLSLCINVIVPQIVNRNCCKMTDNSSPKAFALTIPKQHLSQFFNVFQFLSKIGKEVMLEVDDETVS